MKKDLIIFDCDGTLVNSEMLYNTITSELLTEMGFSEYTPLRCVELFGGQSWSTIKTILEDKHGAAIPRDLVDRYIQIASVRMDKDLIAADGAEDVICTLKDSHSICVASNGERGNVLKSLNMTGLMPYFHEDHVFTKIQVPRPKPAPDLFLFTAEQMGFEPEQCLIIEDSPTGVRAAVAAGITVIGYTGCAHDRAVQADMLDNAGANIITDNLIHILQHV
ncbi:MAG: HAD family phosphatase [Alphaproteobacteria bacterium]|nr:HAD family phosphatase [Alphaproteobacteria bacterium]